MTASEKPHTSASQFESYCRCPEAFRRRYIEKEIIPPGIALLTGTGVHAGAATNFRQKITSHADLPVTEIVDAAVAGFDGARQNGLLLTAEEASAGTASTLAIATQTVVSLAMLHAEEVAPDYQPTFVEQRVRLDLPNSPRDLLGILDLADDQDRVIDTKTSGKRKTQDEVDESPQLTIYAAMHKKLTGRLAKSVHMEVLVKTKTPVRQRLDSDRGPADFQALAHRLNAVEYAIAQGSFPPASPSAWWCCDKFCGFWKSCRFINSERKARNGT